MLTYDDVRKLGLDAQDRAHAKHLIKCRDKWLKEAEVRAELERAGGVDNARWSERARVHANKLNKELETMIQKRRKP
jgi:hypothetical protein